MSDTYINYVYAAYVLAGIVLSAMTLISIARWLKLRKKEKEFTTAITAHTAHMAKEK